MKTAISIPDSIFQAAEEVAKSQGISRSELYVKALKEYLEAQDEAAYIEQVNRVCEKTSTKIDPVVAQMQWRSLPATKEW